VPKAILGTSGAEPSGRTGSAVVGAPQALRAVRAADLKRSGIEDHSGRPWAAATSPEPVPGARQASSTASAGAVLGVRQQVPVDPQDHRRVLVSETLGDGDHHSLAASSTEV
jgi:hypothetical protein